MIMSLVSDRLKAEKIIAIIRGVPPQKIEKTAKALLIGGISCMEVTFDHKRSQGIADTLESIRIIKESFNTAIEVGAGTVLTSCQAEQAVDAGASYIISPNTDIEVIKTTKRLKAVSIPGALTPSEVVRAWQAGADMVKLFPADTLGIAYLKALRAALPHIPMCAVGGVNVKNMKSYFDEGFVCIGIGGALVSAADVSAEKYTQITETAKQLCIQKFCHQ